MYSDDDEEEKQIQRIVEVLLKHSAESGIDLASSVSRVGVFLRMSNHTKPDTLTEKLDRLYATERWWTIDCKWDAGYIFMLRGRHGENVASKDFSEDKFEDGIDWLLSEAAKK